LDIKMYWHCEDNGQFAHLICLRVLEKQRLR
jgi:hypothetical protein